MRTLFAVVLALLLTFTAPSAQADARALGEWHGILSTPGGDLTIIVRISERAGGFTGTMESVDQAPGQFIPLVITEAGPVRLAFTVPAIAGSFAGQWDNVVAGWTGVWSQSGMALPLTLRRAVIAPLVEGMDGRWEARVEREGRSLRLVLRIDTTGHANFVKFDAPDAGANNLAVAGFARDGTRIHFTVPTLGATFDGLLTPDGNHMQGTWLFPGRPQAQITFSRTGKQSGQIQRPRPQTPAAPFPYRVEEVRIANGQAPGVKLSGSLTLPSGSGPFPAAVLITGSGAQDRDETLFSHKPFAVLADFLTRRGIAVLRYDDRGIGASTGTFATGTSADFATDANAVAAYLAQRRDIKHDAIGFVGHSEGGVVAVIAASANQKIGYLVLLAAPAVSMRQMLLTQRRQIGVSQGAPESELIRSEPIMARIFDAVATSNSNAEAAQRVRAILTDDTLAVLGLPKASRDAFAQQMANPWMRYLLRIDMKTLLANIVVPVLALNGSLDRQVEPDANLAAIRTGLAHCPDVTALKLDGLNHLFQTAKTGAPSEYANIEETFSPFALQSVSDWIAIRFLR